MKRFISLLLALGLLFTTEYGYSYNALAAEKTSSPLISIEIGTYNDENERGFFSADTIRYGREKTSAKAGERIVLTFILSGLDKLEYYQLSADFDQSLLSPGYYAGRGENAVWTTGDYEQDFDTIVDGSESFSSGIFEDSFSFTRNELTPTIYLCGYSMSGTAQIPSATSFNSGYTVTGIPLISVGFEVLDDISNIYDVFEWDSSSTLVSVSLDKEEYYLDDGLSVDCLHEYERTVIDASCEEDGYTIYQCMYCSDEFKSDYKSATGHFYVLSEKLQDNKFSYTCSNCNEQVTKTAQELYILWDIEYVNKPPQATNINNSCYLDVVNDNIINAKDYAMICQNYS
ncbi:MAG: hypothetical protein J1E36_04460 [Eubacterium sp.]|nr:hypothetical protein [Eubacterium sp.]